MTRRDAMAFVAGAAVGLILVLAASGGEVDRMTFGDGVFFRYIAEHLTTPLEDVDPIVVLRGVSYRYGRIGLPALMWLASAGQSDAFRYTQPALMILAAGFAAAAAGRFFPRSGPGVVIAPFVAIGFSLALTGGFAEPVSIAALLWGAVFVRDRRWLPAAALFAFAMLTRETAALPIIGILIWVATREGKRPAILMASSFVPVVAWHSFVAGRYGHFPPLDPWLTQRSSPVPFAGMVDAIGERGAATAALLVVHAMLGVIAVVLAKRSIFGAAAAASAVQLLWTPRLTFDFLGDTARIYVYLQMFVVLAVLDLVIQRASVPQPTSSGRP